MLLCRFHLLYCFLILDATYAFTFNPFRPVLRLFGSTTTVDPPMTDARVSEASGNVFDFALSMNRRRAFKSQTTHQFAVVEMPPPFPREASPDLHLVIITLTPTYLPPPEPTTPSHKPSAPSLNLILRPPAPSGAGDRHPSPHPPNLPHPPHPAILPRHPLLHGVPSRPHPSMGASYAPLQRSSGPRIQLQPRRRHRAELRRARPGARQG